MSSSLGVKRKRTGGGGGASSRSSSASCTGADVGQREESTTTLLRTHLEQSLADLRASTSRIESALSLLLPPPPPQRSTLTHLQAPPQQAQPSSHIPHPPPPTTTTTTTCSQCTTLQRELSTLRAQVVQHENEKATWKTFKSWWLDSLAKREQRRRRRRRDPPPLSASSSSAAQGGEGSEIKRIVGKLDRETRRVWADAGVLPSDMMVLEEGEGGREQGEEQSELTLPVHLTSIVAGTSKVDSGTSRRGDGTAVEPMGLAALQMLLAQKTTPIKPPVATTTPLNPLPSTSHNPQPLTAKRQPHPIKTPHQHNQHPTRTTTDLPYIDTTPIRNRLTRRTLHASTCPDCTLFYTHLNNATGDRAEGDVSRQTCSRHRTTFQRAVTPEGYWNIGFPSTQEVDEVNALAKRR
ncbi:uncharacterized protein SPSC_06657 [Sporisorium scitamineum]|uniref:DNA endonuclease activator Ctp1 C-terminal domain-containing protein n=1 Tax=Sporisorium scitamineum TaxID=49012 RepID=A0A140KNT8_9BASI|nr:uncharacterized protein SPSC_06657 [Sporisorium scitamineum]